MSQNEVQKIQRKWDKHFLMKIQSSTVRSEIKISVASRESQCKYWYISNKNDLTSKISVYQCVWSIPWLKYVKGTGLQNKVFEYLTFKSGNFGKMSRESLWNGCKVGLLWKNMYLFLKKIMCSTCRVITMGKKCFENIHEWLNALKMKCWYITKSFISTEQLIM